MRSRQQSGVELDRRAFVGAAATAAGLALAGCAGAERRGEKGGKQEEAEAEVTPGEDLMQEHGALERILLIYDEVVRRAAQRQPFDPAVVSGAAGIVRRFVEDYHEKQEEQSVFPRLQRARREAELVAVLLRQHQRGRELTDEIIRRATARGDLVEPLTAFTRMYRPHAAREDTVLFPAFREVVGRAGYRELGEEFEEREHRLFGEHGFEDTVAEIARLEASLDIGDLAKLTP